MGKMLRWTLRKAKTAESFVLLFWKEDSVEFRREQDRPAVCASRESRKDAAAPKETRAYSVLFIL